MLFIYRQLEAIIRISESLAKMRLAPFALEADVDEALRLFQVSTLDAATSGNLAGKCSLVDVILFRQLTCKINVLSNNYYDD